MTTNDIFNKLHMPDPASIKNVLLLTHTDMDGSGAAVIIKRAFKFCNIDIEHCSNGIMSFIISDCVLNRADDYDVIFACDISCNEIDAKAIDASENSKKLILLDHHMTAAALNKYSWACVCSDLPSDSFAAEYYPDDVRDRAHISGTGLMLDFMLYNHRIDIMDDRYLRELASTISAYDTWDWSDLLGKNSKYSMLNTLHGLYGIKRFEEEMCERTDTTARNGIFTDTDKMLLDIENDKIKEHIDIISKCFNTDSMTIKDDGTTYTIVFCSTGKYLQETFAAMKTKYPGYDLYIINYGTGISVRTEKPEINVGNIVKMYGGGGHKCAGGFKIPFTTQAAYIANAFNADIDGITKPY